jgi:serine/threonine-protein kinase
MPTSASGLAPGTKIDRFILERPLGEGGFGAVYRARHALLGHAVALKLLHPEHAASEEILERFSREAQATVSIGSEHIVQVHDCGTSPEGWLYLAMELLEGRSLEELLRETGGPIAVDRAVDIALQTLDGLAAAHEAGIIHRDLKPANIFLTRHPDTGNDLVKILDFGVSKVTSAANQKALTQTGAMLGTPSYMAPEQFHNARDVDHRVDLYSAAAVTYLMLSGRVPYEAESYADLVVRICCEPPPLLSRIAPHVSEALAAVVMKGLATYPEDRWLDAGSFERALARAHTTGQVDEVTPHPEATAPTMPGTAIPLAEAATMLPVDVRPSTGGSGIPVPGTRVAGPAEAPPPRMSGASSVSVVETPPPGHGAASHPTWRRWLVLLVGVPLAAALISGVIAGVAWITLDVLDDQTEEVANAPTPGPTRNVPPATPGPPTPPAPGPQPAGTAPEDPLGTLITTVLGGVGEQMAGQASTVPIPGDDSTGVELFEPQIIGELGPVELRRALLAAQRSMAECRQPGQHVRARIQVHINMNQVLLAAPAATNTAPREMATCCAERFRSSIPADWSPGSNGMIFFDVVLRPR